VHDTSRTIIFCSSHEIYDTKHNIQFPCDVPGFETFVVGHVIQLNFVTVLTRHHFCSVRYYVRISYKWSSLNPTAIICHFSSLISRASGRSAEWTALIRRISEPTGSAIGQYSAKSSLYMSIALPCQQKCIRMMLSRYVKRKIKERSRVRLVPNLTMKRWDRKDKRKVHPITGHESPEGE
jgi:hypothetical protein